MNQLYFVQYYCIKHEKHISVFKNKQECYRNYTPVEIAINFIEICIDNNLQGIFNAHIDDFTFSFDNLVKKLKEEKLKKAAAKNDI